MFVVHRLRFVVRRSAFDVGVRRTEHYTLGPIMHDEGTKKGQYGVTDTIFKQQFKLNPDLFRQRL